MVNNTLIINKFSEINIKTFTDFNLLYKTCLFRKPDNFICQFKWNNIKINDSSFDVQLWGKTIGTKQYINNCKELTSRLDKIFYYSVAFVFYHYNTNDIFDININMWNEFYNNYILNNNDNINNNNDEVLSINESMPDLDNDSQSYENDTTINDDTLDNDEIINNDEFDEFKELSYEPYYFSSDDDAYN